MFWFKIVTKFLRVLHEGATPRQIAAGFLLGFSIGFIPGLPLHVLVLLLITLLLNVNLNMAIAGLLLALAFGWLLDPWVEALGYWLLAQAAFLEGLWTLMYNSPLIMLTRFNNTVVMGSTAAMCLLAYPLYRLLVRGVVVYRERYRERLNRLKVVQLIKGTKIYGWVQKVNRFRYAS